MTKFLKSLPLYFVALLPLGSQSQPMASQSRALDRAYLQKSCPLLGDAQKDSSLRATLHRGQDAEVLSREGGWSFVRVNVYLEGWVRSTCLGTEAPLPVPEEKLEQLKAKDLRSFHHLFLLRAYGWVGVEGFYGMGNFVGYDGRHLNASRGLGYGVGGGFQLAELWGRGILLTEARLRFHNEHASRNASPQVRPLSTRSTSVSAGLRYIEAYDRKLSVGALAGVSWYRMKNAGEQLSVPPAAFRYYVGGVLGWGAAAPLKGVQLEFPLTMNRNILTVSVGLNLIF